MLTAALGDARAEVGPTGEIAINPVTLPFLSSVFQGSEPAQLTVEVPVQLSIVYPESLVKVSSHAIVSTTAGECLVVKDKQGHAAQRVDVLSSDTASGVGLFELSQQSTVEYVANPVSSKLDTICLGDS